MSRILCSDFFHDVFSMRLHRIYTYKQFLGYFGATHSERQSIYNLKFSLGNISFFSVHNSFRIKFILLNFDRNLSKSQWIL